MDQLAAVRGRAVRLGPGAQAALASLAGASFTLLAAAWRPTLVSDDWAFVGSMRSDGWGSFNFAPRPLGALYHALTAAAFGTNAHLHLLGMAVLNGASAALVWSISSKLLSRRLAVLTTAFWVVLPNRDTTRFWAATGGNMLAVVFVLIAARLAVADRIDTRRYLAIVGFVVASALSYEGGIAIGGLVLVYATVRSAPRERPRRVAIAVAGLAATLGWMVTHTEKTNPLSPGSGKEIFLSAHFGRGVFPPALTFLGVFVLIGLCWSASTCVLPSFRPQAEERLTVAGVVVLLAGAAPFLITGLAHGTSGLFDRGNLYADLGTSMVYAGVCALLWRAAVLRSVTVAIVVVLVGIFVFQDLSALDDYRRAGDDGRRLLAALDAVAPDRRRDLVIAPLPDHHGVAVLIADDDLEGAMALRYHEPLARQRASMANTWADARKAGGVALRGRRLVPLD